MHYNVQVCVQECAKERIWESEEKSKGVWEKGERENDRERDWDWHVFWWSGVVFHINVWCLCCQVPEIWFRKERREKKGKVEKKRQGRWRIFLFFFFMWRRWQLPCIALSLNNGMLICITRDVITSTVKRKHNNSSSAPPWDRLGWPTLALWRDALELWLSQAHTRAHSYAHARTQMYMHTCTHTHSRSVMQTFQSATLLFRPFSPALQLLACTSGTQVHSH